MSDFKAVFSTTWKVVLSLSLISFVGWIAYSIIDNASHSGERERAARREEANWKLYQEQQDASADHTKMPKSVWDKRVNWAVQHHCWFSGMNREDLIRALGQPTNEGQHDTYSTMSWSRKTKDCLRYNGDDCVQYRQEEQHIDLINGYAKRYIDDDCHTLSGEHALLGLRVPAFSK